MFAENISDDKLYIILMTSFNGQSALVKKQPMFLLSQT